MSLIHQHFARINPLLQDQAAAIFLDVFSGLLEDNWQAEGTMIASYQGNVRIGFAARQGNCSLHFHGTEAVQLYHELGGDAPTGRVTIKLPYTRNWNIETVRNTIGIILSRAAQK